MGTAVYREENQTRFIELMRARDLRAMELLYDEYSPVLYGVIFWITNDEKKAEEVLFNTFTYIWNHFNRFDVSVHNICLWMVNIARRLSIEKLSAEERTKLTEYKTQGSGDTYNDQEKMVLINAFFNGMSAKMIAEKFGCSEVKIRSLLHKAVNNLKKEYTPA